MFCGIFLCQQDIVLHSHLATSVGVFKNTQMTVLILNSVGVAFPI